MKPWSVDPAFIARVCADSVPGPGDNNLLAGLERLRARYPDRVGDIRALGAMVALELVTDGDADKPDAALTKALCNKAVESGLILLSCGVRGNVIRILAPLTIEMGHLDEGLAILEASFEACV